MLRYHTAGESHGKALLALVEGFPAGVEIRENRIDAELRRRQGGFGRGGRQRLESDRAEILSGLWRGSTIGSPIAVLIPNHDSKIEQLDDLPCPRPGHGDLAGSIKHLGSIRGVLERASAEKPPPESPPAPWRNTCSNPSASRRSATSSRSAPS